MCNGQPLLAVTLNIFCSFQNLRNTVPPSFQGLVQVRLRFGRVAKPGIHATCKSLVSDKWDLKKSVIVSID